MAVNLFILPFGYLSYKNNNYGHLVVKVRVIFVFKRKKLFKMMNEPLCPGSIITQWRSVPPLPVHNRALLLAYC